MSWGSTEFDRSLVGDVGERARIGLRHELGLPGDATLIAYAGVVKPLRGIETVAGALVDLPHAHLALVTSQSPDEVSRVLGLDRHDLALTDRVHVVPYVEPHEVAGYLASATLGIHPLRHYPNAEIALPTKLFEYLHAGIPVVTSDCGEMHRFVSEYQVGETFPADDAMACADAIRRVEGDIQRYRAAITPNLVARYSWQGQEPVLRRCYERITGTDLTFDESIEFHLDEESVQPTT